MAHSLPALFRRWGKEGICHLIGDRPSFPQDDRIFPTLLQSSQRFLCVFQGQFSYLEPTQDDGRVATVLSHSGQGKGLYSLQRCAGSKHIPVLEKGMVGSPIMSLQTVLYALPAT